MKKIILLLLCIPLLAFGAQSDLVQAYLSANKTLWATGDWTTCQPDGQPDKICTWNAAKLGAQPTQQQLDAMAPYVANTKQARQYDSLLNSGITITSTATVSLNGIYPIDATTQFNINSEVVSILINGTFTNGQTTKPWPDSTNQLHIFTTAQFKTFATAISQYIDAMVVTKLTLFAGQSATWPVPAATIP